MSAAEKIAFKPPFHGMFTEHLHDSAIGRQLSTIGVFRKILAQPNFLTDFVESLQLVGLRFVRAENPEVMHVLTHHFAKEISKGWDVAGQCRARLLDLNRRVAK